MHTYTYRGAEGAASGSNGAGKSTSISMLCGYQEPTSGTAKIFGYVHDPMLRGSSSIN